MAEVSPFEVFAARFPEVTDAYREMKRSYNAAGSLDEKTRQLIQVAVMVAVGSEGGAKDHAQFALDAGATAEEIRQSILMILGPVGMSRASAGISWVDGILE